MFDNFLNPDTLALLIPIVALLGAFSAAGLQQFYKHQERKLELMASQKTIALDDSTATALRNEISLLRQVSTEYDMSIQHTLDQIQKRLDFLESQRSPAQNYVSPAPLSGTEQKIVAGHDVA